MTMLWNTADQSKESSFLRWHPKRYNTIKTALQRSSLIQTCCCRENACIEGGRELSRDQCIGSKKTRTRLEYLDDFKNVSVFRQSLNS